MFSSFGGSSSAQNKQTNKQKGRYWLCRVLSVISHVHTDLTVYAYYNCVCLKQLNTVHILPHAAFSLPIYPGCFSKIEHRKFWHYLFITASYFITWIYHSYLTILLFAGLHTSFVNVTCALFSMQVPDNMQNMFSNITFVS